MHHLLEAQCEKLFKTVKSCTPKWTVNHFNDNVILADEVMEVISKNWSNLTDNEPTSLSLSCYISQIFVYPASYQSYQFWKRKLNVPVSGNVLVCQDCVILDPSGNQMRLTIHPSIGILSKLEASYVEITSIMKSTQCGNQV